MESEFVYMPEIVPVFPLPGVVLFPRTILPLHIFEPRYREMVEDALQDEQFIAAALLKPGYQELYYTRRAPIHTTVGVGRIVEWEQSADGNYNLLLQGVGRAEIVEEFADQPYRLARVEPIPSGCNDADEVCGERMRRLRNLLADNDAIDDDLRKQWLQLDQSGLAFDAIIDLISAGVPAEPEFRQCLLDEPDAVTRADMVLQQLRAITALTQTRRRVVPPDQFNPN